MYFFKQSLILNDIKEKELLAKVEHVTLITAQFLLQKSEKKHFYVLQHGNLSINFKPQPKSMSNTGNIKAERAPRS